MIKPELSQRFLTLSILIPAQLCVILGVFVLISALLFMNGGLLYLIHMGILFDSETYFYLRLVLGLIMFHVDNLLLHVLIDTVKETWENPKEVLNDFLESFIFLNLKELL